MDTTSKSTNLKPQKKSKFADSSTTALATRYKNSIQKSPGFNVASRKTTKVNIKRSAYIQLVGIIRRYIIYKKRHWFSLLLFDLILPISILIIVFYAAISSHLDWTSRCRGDSSTNADASPISQNTTATTTNIIPITSTTQETDAFTKPPQPPLPPADQPRHPRQQFDTRIAYDRSDVLANHTSHQDQSSRNDPYRFINIPDVIWSILRKQNSESLDHSQVSRQKREVMVDFDLYNNLALGSVIWILYLWHFIRSINFLIEDKITGRRFLLYIHGLKKISYFSAHYLAMAIVPLTLSFISLIGMSVLVAPDYLGMNILTFICFTIQTTSLIFALSNLCQSQVAGSLLSLLIWTAHLFLIFSDKVFTLGENHKSLNYVIQFIGCILPEQAIIYIYKNNRKLSTGWDHLPKFKDCKHHGVFPLQNKVLGLGGGKDSTQTVLVYLQPSHQVEYAISDEYLLIIMLIWSIFFMLFAYIYDDFSKAPPFEGYNSGWHDCCRFRDSIKTQLWDPAKPSLIRDSFATLSAGGGGESINGLIPKYFENVDINQDRYLGIYIDQVSKQMNMASSIFNSTNDKTVVDKVSFNIYRGQITLLLGHNGAGKTTIMNMIVGRVRPSSGRVYVNGLDVGVHSAEARSIMSLCPQDSIITDYLTVYEHLELMANIKQGFAINDGLIDNEGINEDYVRQNIVEIATEIGLRDQLGKCAYQLSGGAKRKLSLAMSFVGDSSILVLDEPSSGLDPESRKMIWDAIKRRKTNRTLLISTQHMEEADYLGDRVAIMNRGKITCCGSAVFLKRVLGSGNKLRLALLPNAHRSLALQLVLEFFPEARDLSADANSSLISDKLKKQKLNDVLIELKTSEKTEVEDEDGLIRLFEKLETSHEQYGIKSFSLHGSTVEDVLLNSAKINNNLANNQDNLTIEQGGILSEDIINMKLFSLLRASGRDLSHTNVTQSRNEGSCYSYTMALINKNFLLLFRNWYSVLLWRIIVPLVVFIYIFFTLKLVGQNHVVKKGLTVSLTREEDSPTGGYMYFESYGVVTRVFGFFAFVHFIVVPTEERVSKFKLIILNSRASVFHYWLSQYLVDIVFILIYIIAIFIYLSFSNPILLPIITIQTKEEIVIYGFNTIIRFGIWAKIFSVVITFLFCSSMLFVSYHYRLSCSNFHLYQCCPNIPSCNWINTRCWLIQQQ